MTNQGEGIARARRHPPLASRDAAARQRGSVSLAALTALAACLAGCGSEVVVLTDLPGSGGDGPTVPAGQGGSGHGSGATSGAAGNAASGGADAPSCTPGDELDSIAAAEQAPKFVAADETHVYWSTQDEVRRATLGGGDLESLASGLPVPMGLALDESHVYWVHHNDARLVRAPKHGGPMQVLATDAGSGGAFAMVALDEASAYVRRTIAEIVRVPKQGGAPESVVSGQDGIGSLALDEAWIYYLDAGAIERAPKIGGAAVTVMAAEIARAGGYTGAAPELAVDGARVYWMSSDSGRLLSAPKEGGEVTVHASGIELGQGVVTDGIHVYWSELHRVGRTTPDGLEPLPVVSSDQLVPMGMALTEDLLVFANYIATGPVMRVCK